jgi:hypothetical protein
MVGVSNHVPLRHRDSSVGHGIFHRTGREPFVVARVAAVIAVARRNVMVVESNQTEL